MSLILPMITNGGGLVASGPPTYVGFSAQQASGGQVSNIPVPAGTSTGDLGVIIFGHAQSGGNVAASGFTNLFEGTTGMTYALLTGTLTAGGTVSVTSDTSNDRGGAILFAFNNAQVQDYASSIGSDNEADPSAVTFTAEGICFVGISVDDRRDVTGAASGYTQLAQEEYYGGASAGQNVYGASKTVGASGSENPGIFSFSGSASFGVSTLAIQGL